MPLSRHWQDGRCAERFGPYWPELREFFRRPRPPFGETELTSKPNGRERARPTLSRIYGAWRDAPTGGELENPIVFGVFSAMIPYGTFRAVRENNQSVFFLIGLIGEKPGVNFIASLIRGLFLLRSWSQFSR